MYKHGMGTKAVLAECRGDRVLKFGLSVAKATTISVSRFVYKYSSSLLIVDSNMQAKQTAKN